MSEDGKMTDLVKTTNHLTDMAQYGDFKRARTEVFGTKPPANTAVVTPALAMKGAVVEVEAIATKYQYVIGVGHGRKLLFQSSKYRNPACLISTHRPECFRMNLVERNFPLFKAGLYRCHEAGGTTEKIMRVHIVGQAG